MTKSPYFWKTWRLAEYFLLSRHNRTCVRTWVVAHRQLLILRPPVPRFCKALIASSRWTCLMRCGDGSLEGQMKLAISFQESMSLFGLSTSAGEKFCSPHIPRLLTHGWCQPELVATSYSHSQSTAAACSETWWPRRKSGGRSYAFTPTRLAFGNRGMIDCLSTMMLAQLLHKSFKHLPWNEDLETKALVILISWRFVVTPFLILSSLAQKNSSDHTMPALQGWSQHGGEGWRAFVTGFWVPG